MKRFTHSKSIFLLLLITILYSLGIVSQTKAQTQAMKAAVYNYEHFTKQRVFVDEEIKRQNEGFENHPELGMLYAETPCTDCYEILGKRTETTKTYSKLGSEGRHIWMQSSTDPLHYKDADGRWLTIQSELIPEKQTPGLFVSKAALVPITVNAREGLVQLGKAGHRIQVNRQLELIFVPVNGREQSLGNADWNNYTAGDDGIYVKEIWPGIDMEIIVYRGAAKTNFIIKKPLPAYANGQLVIRDRLNADKGLALQWPEETQWAGPFEFRDIAGRIAYTVHGAVAYEKESPVSSSKILQYGRSAHDELDIFIPGNWLDRTASSYPVVIDPLVQSFTQVTVAGSSYTSNLSAGGCPTLNPATVPADVTVTDIKWSFIYTAVAPARRLNGATTFTMGTCKSPSFAGGIWHCADSLAGNCQGIDISIYADLKSCIPPPQCQPYDLNITMRLARNINNNGINCGYDDIIPASPYMITVEGVTVESKAISVSAPNATICEGDSTEIDATPIYGVGPYSYVWNPGGITGSPITVKPTVSTKYFVAITDQCNRVAHDTVDIFVTPSDNPGFTLDANEICTDKPVHATGLGNGQMSYYSWEAAGSSNPSSTGSQTWTGSFPNEGTYDITMFYQSGNCKFPVTQQVAVYPIVNTVQYDTICDGEVYDFMGQQYTRTGTYGQKYTSVHGCDSTRILYLTVNPVPPVPVLSANTPLCVGDELQLRASDIFGAGYQWNGPGGFNSTARDPKIPKVSFGAAGNYEVTSTMKNCTSLPGILNVVVKPLPAVSLQADKTDICSGDSVRFETPDYPGYSYQWTPEYYMLTNGAAVAYGSVRNPGYIRVAVTDTAHCVNADSVYIETHPCCELFLPSAFTPNQDGKNDLYRIVTHGYQRIGAFRIVNRYGETVFDTGDQNRGWDGMYKGKPQPAGVYQYYIKYTCADGGFYEQKGDLTLIR